MTARIVCEEHAAARVRTLILSQPAKKNAVSPPMLDQLVHELARASRDGVRALVLAGEGGTFCAGSDLSAVEAASSGLHLDHELPDAPLIRACAALEASPLPIVAALDGHVFGAGAELACACDLRIASPGARFCLPPARLGIVYSPEGCARVARLLGLAQAKRLFFTAAVIDANEALRIGLCEELAAAPSAVARALSLATEMAALSAQSLAGMKRTFALFTESLDADARAELESLRRAAFQSVDAQEGRRAFLERRAPQFIGPAGEK